MTTEALHGAFDFSARNGRLHGNRGFYQIFKCCGLILITTAYIFISGLALLTLGLIEIRQSNLTAFNALIATLDQRDWYPNSYLDSILDNIATDRDQYQNWASSLRCSDHTGGLRTRKQPTTQTSGEPGDPGGSGQDTLPKTCAEIRAMVNDHLNALSLLEESVLFKKANLAEYYDRYRDAMRNKDPQLIPVLGLMDSGCRIVTLWARMPFELLEMLLLVCMGALGAVISITRYFVDPRLPNPSLRDLCYRPVAGGVIALGIYIMFRAGQLFFGGSNQNTGMALSTSIFVLAALGLAAGFCAREAVGQIEFVASRMLRGSATDREEGKPAVGGETGEIATGDPPPGKPLPA